MNQVSTDRITTRTGISTWHNNGPFPIEMLYQSQQSGEDSFDLHNASVIEVQSLLKECLDEGKKFRAFGSKWSLNDIAFADRIHDNKAMDMRLSIVNDQVHPDNSDITSDNLVFAQCGATINQINVYLEDQGKSLKTCGGSNGQTIAGVISTGVHGGAMERQCMSDYIKGFHLIIGPSDDDRVYLERSSQPILSEDFGSNVLKSRVIRDDKLFNAALVGLGSFGFIAGVVIEVEPLYSLKRYVRNIEYGDAMELLKNLDFKKSPFKIKEEVDGNGDPITPYHFKPYINQYTRKKCVAEVIYKIPYQKGPHPGFEIKKQLHPDIFRLMHWAMEKSKGKVIKVLSRLLQGRAFPNPKKKSKPVTGTLGDTFYPIDFAEPGFSWALAVDHKQIDVAMDVFCGVLKEHKVPGLTAIKLVKQSESTIGFTKFPISAIIGLDGIQWEPSGGLWPREAIEKEIVKAFIAAGIDFTSHWGKNTDWSFPGLTDRMYGAKKDEWMKQRSQLLSREMADVFSNDFLNRVGLDQYIAGAPVT